MRKIKFEFEFSLLQGEYGKDTVKLIGMRIATVDRH